MQSRETDRTTKTKSSSNPIAPSEPQQWGSFRFRNTAFSTNRNARACRESRSHRCHKQPPDSACAHGDPPRPPSTQRTADGQHLHSKCIPCPQDRLKTTSEAQKQIFGPYCNLFVFTKRFSAIRQISKGRITIMRRLRKGRIASARKSRKGRSPQQRQIPQKEDRHNRRRVPFVSMMCIRAVVHLALFHGPRMDARCSH